MAPTSDDGDEIIFSWMAGGPTGEGMRYQTRDGTVWKDAPAGNRAAVTGVDYGRKERNRVRRDGAG